MKTVHKYPIQAHDHFEVEMPEGAEVLTVQVQRGEPFIWALVDPNTLIVTRRRFRVAGTGHPISEATALKYVGTFQMQGGALVFHLFEEV